MEQVAASEAAPEAGAEIARQALDQLLAVGGAFLAVLLVLDDAPPHGPVRRRHDRVHRPRRCAPGRVEEADDVREHGLVAGALAGDRGLLARHARQRTTVQGGI
jgi:hypothetical protein